MQRDDGTTVLALAGDLIGPAVSRARAALDSVVLGDDLVVDVGEVREIDSIGLGLLVRARWRAVEQGARCRVRGASPAVRHALETSRIGELLALES